LAAWLVSDVTREAWSVDVGRSTVGPWPTRVHSNLTKFVAKHPGGRKRIIRMCGRDASAAFHGQHSSGSRANTVVLKRYKIGTLR
jgi:hypothetical protein